MILLSQFLNPVNLYGKQTTSAFKFLHDLLVHGKNNSLWLASEDEASGLFVILMVCFMQIKWNYTFGLCI